MGFPMENPRPAPNVADSRFRKFPSDSDVDFLQFKRKKRRRRRRIKRTAQFSQVGWSFSTVDTFWTVSRQA